MVRFLFPGLGSVFMAAALAAFVVDGTRSIAAGSIMTFALAETGRWLFPAAMSDLAAWVSAAPSVLRWMVGEILQAPDWLVAGAASALCFLAGRVPPERRRSTHRW